MRAHHLFSLAFLLTTACADDVGEGKVAAEVKDVPEEAAPAAADAPAAQGTVLKVDVAQSKLGAIGAKITAQHPVVFHDFTGEVTVDEASVTKLQFVAQLASLEADHPKLTEHLKGEDFFWIEKYPTAEFTSASVTEGSSEEGFNHTVEGDLTLRGKTKRVSFPAKIATGDAGVEASTEFVINRQDFEITYPGRPDDLIQDNVLMQIAFVAPRG